MASISDIPLGHITEQNFAEPSIEGYQGPQSQFLTQHFNSLIITVGLTHGFKRCVCISILGVSKKSHICSLFLYTGWHCSDLRVPELNSFQAYLIQKINSKIIFKAIKTLTIHKLEPVSVQSMDIRFSAPSFWEL